MALSSAVKDQIGQWYKALQQQIPDFISRAPQRQMIAEVAKTLAGDYPRHLAIEAPTGVGKTLSYLIPGIAVAGGAAAGAECAAERPFRRRCPTGIVKPPRCPAGNPPVFLNRDCRKSRFSLAAAAGSVRLSVTDRRV